VTPIAYRRAAPADVAAVVALVESAFRGEASKAGWTTEADLLGGRRTGPDEIAAILANPDQCLLLRSGLEGSLLASVVLTREADFAWLGMLTVGPGAQNGGVGRDLLAAAERWVTGEWGARRMRMKVIRQRTELIAWYERRGYARTGETAPFPYGDLRFGEPKRPDLEFVILDRTLP
jgi:GNAT superfamily N-acetyltransferase